MVKREFLMLAHKYTPARQDVSGWYISEKLDGTRCFWDGGISRGVPTSQVPWASIRHPRTGILKPRIKPVATGLWSRYGNPIIAPDWWLNQLPCIPLDGELWAGRGGFQLCRSICSRDLPSSDWEQIDYAVFSSPPFESIFSNGLIGTTYMCIEISLNKIRQWLNTRPDSVLQDYRFLPLGTTFDAELAVLNEALPSEGQVYLLRQRKLPEIDASQALDYELSRIVDAGGEGVVIRRGDSVWEPKRSRQILKYKPFSDAEGTIVGFISGRETDKGSKFSGMIGALILDYNGKRLELSGFTDEEREFEEADDSDWAKLHPGIRMPEWVNGKYFKLGQTVTFKYRELSNEGIPREARYLRPWREE